MTKKFNAKCADIAQEEGSNVINMEWFTDREKCANMYGITEPTKDGARAMAELIKTSVLTQIEKEEASK